MFSSHLKCGVTLKQCKVVGGAIQMTRLVLYAFELLQVLDVHDSTELTKLGTIGAQGDKVGLMAVTTNFMRLCGF